MVQDNAADARAAGAVVLFLYVSNPSDNVVNQDQTNMNIYLQHPLPRPLPTLRSLSPAGPRGLSRLPPPPAVALQRLQGSPAHRKPPESHSRPPDVALHVRRPSDWRFRFMGSVESVEHINGSQAIRNAVAAGKLDLTYIPANMTTGSQEEISAS